MVRARVGIEFRCGGAHLHAKQARLAGVNAGGRGEDIRWVMAWQTFRSVLFPLYKPGNDTKAEHGLG